MEYDELAKTREIQMLKAIVPYIPPEKKREIAFLIQFMEYQHITTIFQAELGKSTPCNENDRRTHILNAVKPYCSQSDQELIDTLINLFSVMDNYDLIFHS
ncbi:MAG: hypothetical protein UIC64_03975 [Agathobacter sp.]|nr:hypothetical protein [Agathobacter sp.]